MLGNGVCLLLTGKDLNESQSSLMNLFTECNALKLFSCSVESKIKG